MVNTARTFSLLSFAEKLIPFEKLIPLMSLEGLSMLGLMEFRRVPKVDPMPGY